MVDRWLPRLAARRRGRWTLDSRRPPKDVVIATKRKMRSAVPRTSRPKRCTLDSGKEWAAL